MADATLNTFRDPRTYGVNEVRHQHNTYHVEGGTVANNDTLEHTHPDYGSLEGPFPIVNAAVYTHDGGLVFDFTAVATDDAGDTLELEFTNPHDQDIKEQKDWESGLPVYVGVTHVLADTVTNNAVTGAELVASLQADENFTKWAYAALNGTDVTIYPKGPEGHVRLVTGSTADSVAGKVSGVAILNSARTFTLLDPSTQLWTYSEGKVIITNTSGGTLAGVLAVVKYF